jgi:hypothetical protein
MNLMDLHAEVPGGCISDLRFDEWDAGELPESDAAEFAAHLRGCARCTARRAARDGQASAFLARANAPGVRKQTRAPTHGGLAPAARFATAPPRGRGIWVAAGGAALAAAAALSLVHAPDISVGQRTKGGEQIGFFVKRGDAVFEGQNGQRVRAGDRLRFVVSTPAARYLAVFGRDSSGAVSTYYPTAGLPERVGPGRQIELESSVELDEARGTERIFALFCEEPVNTAKVTGDLRLRGSLQSAADCTVDVIELVKEVGP